jgi:hypothetical protein
MGNTEIEPTNKLVSIHHAFAETDFGKKLGANIRYATYKPDGVSNERWRELLGVDVNNLGHLQLSGNLAKSFIRDMDLHQPGYFEGDERDVLEVALITHDWAESVVGDINYGDKTSDDEAEERAQFEQNLAAFFTGKEERLEQLIKRALDEVIFSPDTKLGIAFNAIERVGYVRTALRAAERVSSDEAGDCEDGFRWLVADVLARHTSKLIEYADVLPPVKTYLDNQEDRISEAYGIIDDDVFWNYPEDKRWEIHANFHTGKRDWDSRLSSSPST